MIGGGAPKLPKDVALAFAGGPQAVRRTTFGGGMKRSTADISFEPQGAVDEKARLRAAFGRRAEHLIVEQDDVSSAPPAPPPQVAKPRRQLGDPVAAGPPSRGPTARRNASPHSKARASPTSGLESASTVRAQSSSPPSDELQLHGFSGIASMAASLPIGSRLPGSSQPRSTRSPGSSQPRSTRSPGGAPSASSAAVGYEFAGGVVGAAAACRPSGASPVSTSPVGMRRARTWSAQVEDSFRLQMAGYRDLQAAHHILPSPSRPPLLL